MMTADMWRDLAQLSAAHLCDIMVEDGVWDRVLSPDLRPVLRRVTASESDFGVIETGKTIHSGQQSVAIQFTQSDAGRHTSRNNRQHVAPDG